MQANCPCGEFLRVLGKNDRNRDQEPTIQRTRGVWWIPWLVDSVTLWTHRWTA